MISASECSSSQLLWNPTIQSISGSDNGSYKVDDTLRYHCNQYLIAPLSKKTYLDLVCLPNRTWSSKPPVCRGTVTQPQVSLCADAVLSAVAYCCTFTALIHCYHYLQPGKLVDSQILDTELSHVNISRMSVDFTAPEQSVAGRERIPGVFFSGDTLHLYCDDGYEFGFLLETISVVVDVDGFTGLKSCHSKIC